MKKIKISNFIEIILKKIKNKKIYCGHGTNNKYSEIIYLIYTYLNLKFQKKNLNLKINIFKKKKF